MRGRLDAVCDVPDQCSNQFRPLLRVMWGGARDILGGAAQVLIYASLYALAKAE